MKECKTCLGYGLWAMGDKTPMGPIDASDGLPTVQCPECKANANPADDDITYCPECDEPMEPIMDNVGFKAPDPEKIVVVGMKCNNCGYREN